MKTILIENGSMAYMSNVTINGRMNTEKKGVAGFFSVDLSKDTAATAHVMGSGTINLQKDAFLHLDAKVHEIANSLVMNNNSTLDLSNNKAQTTKLGKLDLQGDSNLTIDFDIKNIF